MLQKYILTSSSSHREIQWQNPRWYRMPRRLDFIALNNYYEGVGVHAIDIVKADNIIQDLFYSGKKMPHRWWDEFKRQLTDAFNTYDWHKKHSVHSDNQKLRMLNRKNQLRLSTNHQVIYHS